MAPKTFHRFRKLPMELRLRIWNLTMEPRVIRAKWDVITIPSYVYQFYVLTAGPIPRALIACKESREEAKRKYCFVKSHLHFTDLGKSDFTPWARKSIWINFDIDTLYFVNFPGTLAFLKYMLRLSKKRIGGANGNIKYIAFQASVLQRLNLERPIPKRLPFFYQLVIDQPSIEKFIIMLDNSGFEDDKHPQNYSLSKPSIIGENGKGGGRWGGKSIRQHLKLTFDDFFTNPKLKREELSKFKKFKKDNSHWALPTFIQLSITKKPKQGYAGDGLPLNQLPKKRATPKPKPVNVTPEPTKTIVDKVLSSKSR